MKFRQIFQFELKYQLRHASTWIYLSIPCVFPFLLAIFSTPTDDNVYLNSPVYIIFSTVFVGVIWLLTGGAIAGNAATRDLSTLQHPLTYTTPITKLEYFGGRFMAALTLNALAQLAIITSFILAVYIPGVQKGPLGPFRPDAYLTVFFYLALPNAFIATSFQFAAATLNRRAIMAYLVSAVMFPVISVFIGTSATAFTGKKELWELIDVAGISVVASTETWTTFEHNNRVLTFDGMLLWNRVMWLAIALGSLAFTYFRFEFAHVVASTWWRRKKTAAVEQTSESSFTPVTVPSIGRAFGLATQIRQTRSIAWSSFKSIVQSPIGTGVALLLAFHFVVFAQGYLTGANIPTYATAMNLIHIMVKPVSDIQTPLTILTILIAFFAGELIWKERDSRMDKISDIVPVSEWMLFLGKFLGLALTILLWLGMLVIAALLIQVFDGYGNFEIGVFIQTLMGLQFVEYLLFALIAMVIHVVVNHKYLGHVIVLFVLMYMIFHAKLGIEHNLLVYGETPGWRFTDMRGFKPFLIPWLWFKTYWIGWAILFAVVARLFWVRSILDGISSRLKLVGNRLTRPTVLTFGVGILTVLLAGGFIGYNTNVLNDYSSSKEKVTTKALYEKTYSKYKNSPRPTLTASTVQVDIYPGRRNADVHGIYTLVNKTNTAIGVIHVSNGMDAESTSLEVKEAELILNDVRLGFRSFKLNESLQPGDSLQIAFDVHLGVRGFTNQAINPAIASNGSYFINYDWFPSIGYLQARELTNDAARKTNGLAPYVSPSLYDSTIDKTTQFNDLITLKAIVTTDEDQIAVAPGNLVRQWNENGRNYFQYATSAPIRNTYPFFSGKYAVNKSKWNDVDIWFYYHPGHPENVDKFVKGTHDALEYYTKTFGPYPYKHLTLAERSGYTGALNAEPGSIDYGESFTLYNVSNPNTLDIVYFAAAHEVAHQWWGAAQVMPARGEGGIVISETLANYSGLNVLKSTHGEEHVQKLLTMWRNAYEVPRKRDAPPLLQANESFLGYRKGPFAMYALGKYIGFDKINEALKRFATKHNSGIPPLPTSLDLYRELTAVTPDSIKYLLRDLFEKNIYWQLKTEAVEAKQVDSNNWQVSIYLNINKVEVDSTGAEHPLPMNDWIEVGIYSKEDGDPIHLKKYRLKTGKQTLIITVPEKPVRAGVDPYGLLIDLNLEDNTHLVSP